MSRSHKDTFIKLGERGGSRSTVDEEWREEEEKEKEEDGMGRSITSTTTTSRVNACNSSNQKRVVPSWSVGVT